MLVDTYVWCELQTAGLDTHVYLREYAVDYWQVGVCHENKTILGVEHIGVKRYGVFTSPISKETGNRAEWEHIMGNKVERVVDRRAEIGISFLIFTAVDIPYGLVKLSIGRAVGGATV